jgi:fatty acid desaturase
VPCRGCGGKGRTAARRRARGTWRAALARWADAAAAPAGAFVGTLMRWSATVPGIAGAAALTWGVAMVVHGVFHQVPSLGAALVVGGVFGLLADRRL